MAGGPQQPAESEYFADLKGTAERLGIAARVRFLGERTDVDHLLCGADVHCQPNTRPELFGITFIEGLAAALPVVSTRIGAAVEILDGYGLLVAPDDPSALANAFERLIVDPAQRAALGAIGPARAARLCDPAENLDQLHSIFRDQLGLAS
jgi:glycosyltransferase involved in cell wall biosynthesis